MPATRFSLQVNQLRAALRGQRGTDLLTTLHRQLELFPAAALAADNSSRYIAANSIARELLGYTLAELSGMTVADLTPQPNVSAIAPKWQAFVAKGGQRGSYDVCRKDGAVVRVRYWAYASVAPGIHISLLVPEAGDDAGPRE